MFRAPAVVVRWARRTGPAAGPPLVGLAVVWLAWWRFVGTGGELFQRDLEYPLYISDALGDFFPLLAPDGLSALGHLSMAPLMAPALAGGAAAGRTTSEVLGGLVVGQSLLAFVTMYLFFGVAIGATRGSIPHVWSGALTAGLFYALNPWAMARVEHLGVLAGYALAPAVLATAVLAFRRQSRRFAVATGLLLAIAAVSPHYLAYVTILLVALLMWRLIRAGSVGVARRHLGNAALGVLAFLALEAFVLAPSIASAWLGRGLPAEFAAAATDLALGSSGSPWLDALMLTGNARWRAEMRPGGIGAWAWTVVGLAPAATLPVALVVNRTRRTVTASLIALAALPIALAGVAELPGIRPLLEAAVAGIPGGRALREPDKLLGLAALAYAWGVGMVAATVAGWGSIVPRRRAPLGAIPIVLAFVLVLVAYTTPAVAYFLWRPAVANWLPRAIPAGYAAVLDAVRADAAPDERVLVLESDERVPRWDATRLLRHLVTRAMPSLGTVTVRHPVNAYDVSLLETLADEDLADGVASTGAGRVIVARDTAAGEALAARLAGRPEFQPEATSDVLAVYRVARPGQPLAWATGALTAVAGYDPAVGRRGAAVVVDAAVGRCPPADPSLALVGDPALDRHAVRFACLPRQYLAPLRAGTGTSSDWQEADGSPAGLARWLAALRSADLRVTSQGYGLGFAWTGLPGQLVPPGAATFHVQNPSETAQNVYLRALVGDGVAPLRVSLLRSAEALAPPVTIQSSGPPSFRWVSVATNVSPEDGPTMLQVEPGPGFAAANALAAVPVNLDAGLTARDAPIAASVPSVELRRVSRTEMRGTLRGADGPFVLVVNESYHPGWRAHVAGGDSAPFPMAYARMGFRIAAVGDLELTLRFVPQDAYVVGIAISLAAGLVILGYLAWPAIDAGRLPFWSRRRARQTTDVP